jgi:NAD(P)-dependent dehydrogenase (short-subunit alcohol dehydrogenase family)
MLKFNRERERISALKSYRDKVVVITGGATGIGFSFAKRFGGDGAKLVIAGRRKTKVDEAVKALNDMGYQAVGTACDVSELSQVEALADFAWQSWGRADVIMNNAGIAQMPTPIIATAPEDVERVMRTNYFGVWYCCHVFGKRFIEQGTPAAIYNVGSENSLANFVFMAGTYEASKHALHAMTDAMREEVPDFIEVSFVLPGFVSSEMTDPFGKGLTMETDRYTGIAFPQLQAGEFYVVSHAYNMKRIDDRYQEISAAYAKYAPRYEGDDEFDARSLMAKIRARMQG